MLVTPKSMYRLEDDPGGKVLTPQPREAEDANAKQRKRFSRIFLDVVSADTTILIHEFSAWNPLFKIRPSK